MKLRNALVETVSAWIETTIPGTTVLRETDDAELRPPYVLVRIMADEPLMPGEPVRVMQVAIVYTADAAESDASETITASQAMSSLFDDIDGFTIAAELAGVFVSAVEEAETSSTVEGERWLHGVMWKMVVGGD